MRRLGWILGRPGTRPFNITKPCGQSIEEGVHHEMRGTTWIFGRIVNFASKSNGATGKKYSLAKVFQNMERVLVSFSLVAKD
jgi:hypothetical protein